jgi:glutamate synthase (NADPH/NADH) small chain
MGKLGGFLESDRKEPGKRSIEQRLKDYLEVSEKFSLEEIVEQSGRCMDCGVPFCHFSCPLCNRIPDFNDAIHRKQYKRAAAILTSTNNFPEFTGRLCPALCEKGCTLGLGFKSVTISDIEKYIIEIAFEEGWIKPEAPETRTGKKIAIIGSGPAGLAAADLLNKAGHSVCVFEKNNRAGGILSYGIPDFKIEKTVVDRRINLLKEEGVLFKTGVNAGKDIETKKILKDYDAVLLAMGAEKPRDVAVPGRDLKGVYFAMSFLIQQNKRVSKENYAVEDILATGKNVIVIGGGDTGADCVGTSNRHGAKSITQVEIMPLPPKERTDDMPWPTYPNLYKTSTSHEEGCERIFAVSAKEFIADDKGHLKAVKFIKVDWLSDEKGNISPKEIEDSEFTLDAELAVIAVGFIKPDTSGFIEELGVKIGERGNVIIDDKTRATNVKKVFGAGDVQRGASLIVHAIADGRRAARAIDIFLSGESEIPEV